MSFTPTSTQEVDSVASSTASLVSSAITVVNGDVLIVKVGSEDSTCAIGACSGGSQTWTTNKSFGTAGNCPSKIFSTTVTGNPGTVTVTVAFSGSSGWHSMVVERFAVANAQLAATPATNVTVTGTTSGGPSTTITTVGTGSVVSWSYFDFSARAPGTVGYRSSAVQDGLHDKSTTNYVAYYAYQQAAAAGSQTFGTTTPATSSVWTLMAIEIQAASVAAVPDPVIIQRPAVIRASNW